MVDPVQPDPVLPDPYPPIPAEWHDLWASIKREARDKDEAIHNLGVAIAQKLDEAAGATAQEARKL